MALVWNCQGLGNPMTVKALRKLVRAEDPSLVFLMETKLMTKQMERVKIKLGFDCGIFVDRVGRSGGLAFLWRKSVDVTLRSFSFNHIDVTIESDGSAPCWRFTGFYGEPATSKRHIEWNLLRKLGDQTRLPWCCMGDFDEILSFNEKEGGANRPSAQITGFKMC